MRRHGGGTCRRQGASGLQLRPPDDSDLGILITPPTVSEVTAGACWTSLRRADVFGTSRTLGQDGRNGNDRHGIGTPSSIDLGSVIGNIAQS